MQKNISAKSEFAISDGSVKSLIFYLMSERHKNSEFKEKYDDLMVTWNKGKKFLHWSLLLVELVFCLVFCIIYNQNFIYISKN